MKCKVIFTAVYETIVDSSDYDLEDDTSLDEIHDYEVDNAGEVLAEALSMGHARIDITVEEVK